MDLGADPPALFALPVEREPLRAFRKRFVHRGPGDPPRTWTFAYERGRTSAGTVHLVTAEWLPACGTGLNGWDYRGLQPTGDEVTCVRCGGILARSEPSEGQLTLF